MNTVRNRLATYFSFACICLSIITCNTKATLPDHHVLAQKYYHQDASWYLDNIPFFECSDKQIEEVYHYRWKMYKAHIRNVGPNNYVITEFIDHVSWDRDPFCTINAASMHHIYEGRWLKDPAYMNGYINNLYQQGGNNRKYSESVADATYARYLVDGNKDFITKQLDSMIRVYHAWNDHWEEDKQLYYIPAMPDATEYTVASIDASGGKDGFEGGDAFRPTINSYMYGNALAIAKIAALSEKKEIETTFLRKAEQLKKNIEKHLWNDSLNHFSDRFKVNNAYVHYWDFIRNRELAGMVPWYFNLPIDTPKFNEAWKHVTDTTYLLGKFGFRTNEPAYEYYFHQFLWHEGKRGSQWNGPSWPFQSSLVLTAMANMLQNYTQHNLTNSDYLKVLRLYTQQHYLPDGTINLVENYDPNLGGPIVHYYWSNHYNHSSYNNLIISGLCGVRPMAGDNLALTPLVDNSISYFYLGDVLYHGHKITLVYDRDGTHYNVGKGLVAFVDGKKAQLIQEGNTYTMAIGESLKITPTLQPANVALNFSKKEYPKVNASVNSLPDSLNQAIDGRIWFFPEIRNRWSTKGSTAQIDWFSIDFGKSENISTMKIYLFEDDQTHTVPDMIMLSYMVKDEWTPISITKQHPSKLTGNTANVFQFSSITTSKIKITLKHSTKPVAITEVECF